MPESPQLPRWSAGQEAKFNARFELIDEIHELRTHLKAGKLKNFWQHAVIENDCLRDEAVEVHGLAITKDDSAHITNGLLNNKVQAVMVEEFRHSTTQPNSRLTLVTNRMNCSREGVTWAFQSRVVKVDEFNNLLMHNNRCFRPVTIDFDDYETGEFGPYYDHDYSGDGIVRINSSHRLFEPAGETVQLPLESLNSGSRQRKIIQIARVMINSFEHGFLNRNL